MTAKKTSGAGGSQKKAARPRSRSESNRLRFVEQLTDQGFVIAQLTPAQAGAVQAVYEGAEGFFALPDDVKLEHGLPTQKSGYRPFKAGFANKDRPDEPDLNDSFVYFPHREIPNPTEHGVPAFVSALETYRREVAAPLTAQVIDELSERYDYAAELPFGHSSFVQVNSYGESPEPPGALLQHPHEDGNLLTVHSATGPGLVLVRDGAEIPVSCEPDQALIMAGGILTAMTAGELQPTFHQVRNPGLGLDRKAVMYFARPDVFEGLPIPPFKGTTDVAPMVLRASDAFGLNEGFVDARPASEHPEYRG